MARKRGQGEGSIYRRKDGRWVAQVTIQAKHVVKYFHSQSECREWLRTTQTQIQNGLTLAGAQTTLADFLGEWLVAIASSVRPKTFNQYKQIVRQHILPTLGKIKVKDLRPEHIQALYNQKIKGGTGSRTVILIHAVLHKALKQALKWGKIGRNPADAVNRPKFQRKEMRILDDKQVRTLLLTAKGTRCEALFWMAVATGMREGELLGLRWSDLDWHSRQVHIQRQLQRIDGEYTFTEPKSAAGRRTIALGEASIGMLRAHLGILQNERHEAGDRWQENDLIFPSSLGTPWDKRNMYRFYKRFLKEAGLPDIRFHDLRHTAATLMRQQGVDIKVVQQVLGHADVTLTLNTYSHVSPAMQVEAAAKVDELLTPIEVTEALRKVAEQRPSYVTSKGETGINVPADLGSCKATVVRESSMNRRARSTQHLGVESLMNPCI